MNDPWLPKPYEPAIKWVGGGHDSGDILDNNKMETMMKLTDVMKVWDIIHVKDVGELGFCDLEDAIEEVVGLEINVPGCLPTIRPPKQRPIPEEVPDVPPPADPEA